ncbi:MAG: endo alpha-1,4 polygalactosaminidase [Thermomicrobiales bacterium]
MLCYMSMGTWEDWRPDAGAYPAGSARQCLGRMAANVSWSSPHRSGWLRFSHCGSISARRKDSMRSSRQHRYHGNDAEVTGFPLTEQDQLAFNRWLADAAHARGLGKIG